MEIISRLARFYFRRAFSTPNLNFFIRNLAVVAFYGQTCRSNDTVDLRAVGVYFGKQHLRKKPTLRLSFLHQGSFNATHFWGDQT